jgi:hypothetical protein
MAVSSPRVLAVRIDEVIDRWTSFRDAVEDGVATSTQADELYYLSSTVTRDARDTLADDTYEPRHVRRAVAADHGALELGLTDERGDLR